MDVEKFDYLVIGSGLAGLTFALRAAEHGSVAVLTKADISETNTSYAQGGIAAAVGEADSWELHEEDTLVAGAGLCDSQAVRFLVQRAPDAIDWLVDLGARFDKNAGGDLSLGREGGHSRSRIVKHRDNTGWEIERTMVEMVRSHPEIQVFEHAFATSLLMSNGVCAGASAEITDLGTRLFNARATLLATGGCGRVYQHTTNPAVATGDGLGLADRVGASIGNMEFMQFHPTTLYHPQMRSFLLTEAMRGAGGTLRNHLGTRFMLDYDPRLELAPRDIVARATEAEMKRLGTWCVYLDVAHLPSGQIREEFPTVFEKLLSIGIQIDRDWIPVVPAQHYSCGGVVTDLQGKTNVPGLYASGEVACTGVHGANRLASNSLLEAIVFSTSAAEACSTEPGAPAVDTFEPPKCVSEADSVRIRRALQRTMTAKVGIVRTSKRLQSAKSDVEALVNEFEQLPDAPFSPHPIETRSLLAVGSHVIAGALRRRENVGLHFNEDLVGPQA